MSAAHAPACAHVFHISGHFRSVLLNVTEDVPMTCEVVFRPGLLLLCIAAIFHKFLTLGTGSVYQRISNAQNKGRVAYTYH